MYRSTEDIGVYPTVGAVPSVRNMTHPTASDPFSTAASGPFDTVPVSGSNPPPDSGSPPEPATPPDIAMPPEPATPPDPATVGGGTRRRRALVVAGACAAALAGWFLAGPLLGIDLAARSAPGAATTQEITAASVILSSILAGLAGWALLALLERLTTRGVMVWRWLAGVVTLLSLFGPLTLAQGTGATVVLPLLHLAVAGVLLVALPGARPGGAGRPPAGRAEVRDVSTAGG